MTQLLKKAESRKQKVKRRYVVAIQGPSVKLCPKKADPFNVFRATDHTVTVDTDGMHNVEIIDCVTLASTFDEAGHLEPTSGNAKLKQQWDPSGGDVRGEKRKDLSCGDVNIKKQEEPPSSIVQTKEREQPPRGDGQMEQWRKQTSEDAKLEQRESQLTSGDGLIEQNVCR